MSGRERESTFLKKRSRRQTNDTVRAALESENEDYKRFPYFLRKACEENHIPFMVDINDYLTRDDGETIQIETPIEIPPEYAAEQTKNPKINTYSDMDLTIRKLTVKAPRIESRLFSALTKTMSNFSKLYTLRLDYCDLTSNDIQSLAEQLQSTTKGVRELSIKGSPNKTQNFYLLVGCGLKYLNLKFCGINENGLKMLADEFLKCAPNCSLVYLDLSSNMVFDEGCKYVAKILRCNRSLHLLNLADCKIGNEGFEQIIKSFQKFPLCDEEMYVRRKLRMEYYKLLPKENDGFLVEKKNVFSAGDQDHVKDALTVIEEQLRKHPFTADCVQEDTEVFCKGNYKLQSLNVSFNHLTKSSFDLTLNVLLEQSTFGIEKGLNRVLLEGNFEAHKCENVQNAIDELLMSKKVRNSMCPSLHSSGAKTRPSIKRRKSSFN